MDAIDMIIQPIIPGELGATMGTFTISRSLSATTAAIVTGSRALLEGFFSLKGRAGVADLEYRLVGEGQVRGGVVGEDCGLLVVFSGRQRKCGHDGTLGVRRADGLAAMRFVVRRRREVVQDKLGACWIEGGVSLLGVPLLIGGPFPRQVPTAHLGLVSSCWILAHARPRPGQIDQLLLYLAGRLKPRASHHDVPLRSTALVSPIVPELRQLPMTVLAAPSKKLE